MAKKKGQVIIVTALILALLMLAISTNLHITSITYQSLYYDDTKEVVDNINQDLNRILQRILAESSQQYYKGSSIETLYSQAQDDLSYWLQSIIVAYSSKGVQIKVAKGNIINLDWKNGISQANLSISLNLAHLNFYNWSKNYIQYLKISDVTLSPTYKEIYFKLSRENGLPGEIFNSTSCWLFQGGTKIDYTSVESTGEGAYVIKLKKEIPKVPIKLYVKDKRCFYVGVETILATNIFLIERPAFFYTDFSTNPSSEIMKLNGFIWNGTMLCGQEQTGSVIINKNLRENSNATKLWFLQKIYVTSPGTFFNNITVCYKSDDSVVSIVYSLKLSFTKQGQNIRLDRIYIYKDNRLQVQNNININIGNNWLTLLSFIDESNNENQLNLTVCYGNNPSISFPDKIDNSYKRINLTLSFGYQNFKGICVDDLIVSESEIASYSPLKVTLEGLTGMDESYYVRINGTYNGRPIILGKDNKTTFNSNTLTATFDLTQYPIIKNATIVVYFKQQQGNKINIIEVARGSFDYVVAGDYYSFVK
jgi:hypothetical protein